MSAPKSTVLYDVVGKSLLESPMMAPLLKSMAEQGSPWLFGTDQPGKLAERHGWTAVVTDIAEPGNAYNRWFAPPAPADAADALARRFKALGDPVRLRLLSLIASRDGGEVCVCELTEAFTLTGPTISHHLRVLREAGLVDAERRGTWVYYRVTPEMLASLSRLLDPATLTNARTST